MPALRQDREGPIHRAIVQYLRSVLPHALVHHGANEINLSGKRIEIAIARAKSLGMTPGWPDIEVMTAQGALFFEVKAPGGYPSKTQAAVIDKLRGLGFPVGLVRSIEDTRACLRAWGIVTREGNDG